jgi:hypothetical protein
MAGSCVPLKSLKPKYFCSALCISNTVSLVMGLDVLAPTFFELDFLGAGLFL